MTTLRINFEAGWRSHQVAAYLDGQQVFTSESTTTDYSVGLASTEEIETLGGPHTLAVTVTGIEGNATTEVEVGESGLDVGISLDDGVIVFRVSEDGFTYY